MKEIPNISLKLLNTTGLENGTVFAVSLLGSQTIINEADGLPFAMLHSKAAELLKELESSVHASVQLFCETKKYNRTRKTKSTNVKATTSTTSTLLHAVVYGSLNIFETTGDFLQEHGIYLQDPSHGDRSAVYQNPHRLSQIDSSCNTIVSPEQQSPRTDVDTELLGTSKDPFASIESEMALAEAETPWQVKTPLYPHQRQALTYMLRRERGWAFGESCNDVYRTVTMPNGRLSYLNTISGEQQFWRPPNFCGGILADPMGLGKSLSIIALIASHPAPSIPRQSPDFCKATLLVVPYTLIPNWESQLKCHLYNQTLSWTRYHGSNRKADRLHEYDVVITTYHTLAMESKKAKQLPQSVIQKRWHRIVLDEAHLIRSASAKISKAVCLVKSPNRWAVTGTPIQNRLTDLFSILSFLGAAPYCYPRVFEEQITRPWKAGSQDGIQRLMALMRALALRRPKSVISLPKRDDAIRFVTFNDHERESYNRVKATTFRRLNGAICDERHDARLRLNALQWINSLRQLCNVGPDYLVRINLPEENSSWDKKTAQRAFNTMESAGMIACVECNRDLAGRLELAESQDSDVASSRLFECLRLLCGDCCHQLKHTAISGFICGCGNECKSFEVSSSLNGTTSSLSNATCASSRFPCKVRKLLQELQTSDDTKSVVFSCWVSTLDLVAEAFEETIPFMRLDGRMKGKERASSVEEFKNNPNIKVLLVSMNCGAVGIDLTAASRVYLMEPQWNPMLEDQALDRVHRLGQTKPVKTIRFIVRNSFEENIQKLQARKRHLVDMSLSASSRYTTDGFQAKLEFYKTLLI